MQVRHESSACRRLPMTISESRGAPVLPRHRGPDIPGLVPNTPKPPRNPGRFSTRAVCVSEGVRSEDRAVVAASTCAPHLGRVPLAAHANCQPQATAFTVPLLMRTLDSARSSTSAEL